MATRCRSSVASTVQASVTKSLAARVTKSLAVDTPPKFTRAKGVYLTLRPAPASE